MQCKVSTLKIAIVRGMQLHILNRRRHNAKLDSLPTASAQNELCKSKSDIELYAQESDRTCPPPLGLFQYLPALGNTRANASAINTPTLPILHSVDSIHIFCEASRHVNSGVVFDSDPGSHCPWCSWLHTSPLRRLGTAARLDNKIHWQSRTSTGHIQWSNEISIHWWTT